VDDQGLPVWAKDAPIPPAAVRQNHTLHAEGIDELKAIGHVSKGAQRVFAVYERYFQEFIIGKGQKGFSESQYTAMEEEMEKAGRK
jgi:hypothetical protein